MLIELMMCYVRPTYTPIGVELLIFISRPDACRRNMMRLERGAALHPVLLSTGKAYTTDRAAQRAFTDLSI